jgi:hypothetical protein
LSLDDLSDRAFLGGDRLLHPQLAQALISRYGLDEWTVARDARRELLAYRLLSDAERTRAVSPEGLSLGEFGPDRLLSLLEALGLEPRATGGMSDPRFQIRLRPPGVYEWCDWDTARLAPFPIRVEVSEPTRAWAEAALDTYLTSAGETMDRVEQEKGNIGGPKPGVWTRLRIGGGYLMRESDGREESVFPLFKR